MLGKFTSQRLRLLFVKLSDGRSAEKSSLTMLTNFIVWMLLVSCDWSLIEVNESTSTFTFSDPSSVMSVPVVYPANSSFPSLASWYSSKVVEMADFCSGWRIQYSLHKWKHPILIS